MRKVMAVGSTIVLVAGCGPSTSPAPQQQRPAKAITVQGDEQRALAAASEMDRAIALKRAIYDSGSVCTRVTGTGRLADYKSLQMWQANCDDGTSFAIFIAANGGVQVRPCADLHDLKLPECTLPATKPTKASG